ncbi:MAG: hypothetical protein EBV73_07695 [Rhodocyclales bacterium]|nr:hypothetical protein [Rhodocyclales bacterium]
MPKGIQKSVPKLAIVGSLAVLVFNFPILSVYRGHMMSVPALYVGLFGAWLLIILLARRAAEPFTPKAPYSQTAQERKNP